MSCPSENHRYSENIKSVPKKIKAYSLSLKATVSVLDPFCLWKSSVQDENYQNSKHFIRKNEVDIITALDLGNIDKFGDTILEIPEIKCVIIHKLMLSANQSSNELKRRKRGFISCLMQKGIEDLVSFAWDDVFVEAMSVMPDLVSILLASMVKINQMNNVDFLCKVIPKVAMIYSIITNSFNHELSLLTFRSTFCFTLCNCSIRSWINF
jgi:hypothetical protein